MRRILSTAYTDALFNLAILSLRVVLGLMICLQHGIPKLANFSELQHNFYDPFHIGHRFSLILNILAEVFASMLLALGLFSRIAAGVLCINMAVAIFLFHKGQELKSYELAVLFFTGFLVILLTGPGKISVDAMSGK
jgi:putative oxidoreductase